MNLTQREGWPGIAFARCATMAAMQTTSPVAPVDLSALIDEIDQLIGPDADVLVHQYIQQGGE